LTVPSPLLWLVAFLGGIGVGLAIPRAPAIPPSEAAADIERSMIACGAACSADLRNATAAIQHLHGELVFLEIRVEDCVVPGTWLDAGVVPLPFRPKD
jgi:hypothetical protein